MPDAEIIATLRNKYQALRPVMSEKVRRRWAACEAMALGWGGITAVAEATGLSRPTIRAGLAEVQGGVPHAEETDQTETHRVRRGGGGRRRVTEKDRTLLKRFAILIGVFYPWGPAVSSAVDKQEHPSPCRGTWAPGTPRNSTVVICHF